MPAATPHHALIWSKAGNTSRLQPAAAASSAPNRATSSWHSHSRNNMKRFSLLTLCFLATISAQAANDPISPTNFDLPAIDAYVAREVKDLGIAGVSLAIVRNGQLVFAKGYGRRSLEKQEPVTTNTLFAIGSITKQFTCACILLLAEEGKLSVEDKVAKYFPDLPRAMDITLLDLMNHVSGSPDYYP